MGMDTWTELSNPRDLSKVFDTPDYAAWKGLRDAADSRYVGLCLPRVLSRVPYGAKSEPVEEFAFEEETDGHMGEKYAWMNAAYAMAVNINRAYKEYGWCTRIRGVQSGGEVVNLPTHTFPTDDGGVDLKCPTEIAISDRREAELAKSGLIPLIHRKNTDKAAFIGAQSLYKPKAFSGPDGVAATASDNLSARLPYMFAVSRFAHYLKCMVRDKVGSYKEKEPLRRWLQEWITDYVDGDPVNSSEETKARRPLSDARIDVFEDEENPGYYSVVAVPYLWLGLFFLAPFVMVLRIALSDAATALPPYAPHFEGFAALRDFLAGLDLENFGLIWEDPLYWQSYLFSLRIAALTTLIALAIGYPLAYAMASAPARWRAILLVLVILPFWTSFLIRVYAWIGILRPEGLLDMALTALGLTDQPLRLLNTEAAVLIGMVYSYLPFMVLPLYATLEKLDRSLLEAAADLGATPLKAFLTVTLPLSLPGIL
ncbi:MAG: type VI secretion system contractile sheath large subunit, partial [Hyphomicrobiales bacterium]